LPFFTRWHFSDLNDLFREMEEMMEREFRELSRKVPKDLVRERTLHAFRARIHKIEDWTVKGEPLWWNARNAEDVKLMIKMVYAAVAGLTKYWRRWGKTKNRWNSFSARVGSLFPSLWWIPLSRSKQAFRQVVTFKHLLSFAKCFHITGCYHSSSSHVSSSTLYDMQNVQRLFLGAPQSLQKSMPQFVHL